MQPPPADEARQDPQPTLQPMPAKAPPERAAPERVVKQPVHEQSNVVQHQQVTAKPFVQRPSEQSRHAHQRIEPIVRSNVMTRPTSIEHAQALPTQHRTAMETRHVQAMPSTQEPKHPVEVPQEAVSSATAQSTPAAEVQEGEVVERKMSVSRPSRAQELAEAVTAPAMREVSVVEQVIRRSESLHAETVQSEPVAVRQSTPEVSAARSAGEIRAHYGWLKAELLAHIERLKRYPQFALDNKWEGRVVVRAVIWADGHLTDLSVVESSGHEVLDRESVELLKRISPLPLKHELGAPQVTLRIPINYGIR